MVPGVITSAGLAPVRSNNWQLPSIQQITSPPPENRLWRFSGGGEFLLACEGSRGLFRIWRRGTMALRKFLSPIPAQLVAPSEPQALAVGLRRIVVLAHG
ncbi:hypothetical protein Pla52n_05500 [Stieleria varia]|uniref:Uncharacterized protein n=1 Tax=Stieleria varia TaxID=2528005 RepID=A0A5C6B7E1_9BACT|nr:hypothetical protein Pla52n_05500 [Stieleria varia]